MIGGNKYSALLLPYGVDGLSEGPPNAMQMLAKWIIIPGESSEAFM